MGGLVRKMVRFVIKNQVDIEEVFEGSLIPREPLTNPRARLFLRKVKQNEAGYVLELLK